MIEKSKGEDKEKIDLIVTAAQKRFAHYGLCKTTMNEIATDVGMGKASLYYYFPDKETIFQAVIRKEQLAFIDEMNKMIHSGVDASLQIRQYVKLRIAFFQQFVNLAKLRSESFMNSKPIFGKVFEDFHKMEIELVKQIIQNGISDKKFRKINKQEYAELLIHIIQGLRLVKMKYKDVNEFDKNDYDSLEKEYSKVIVMFLKDLMIE